MKKLIITTGFIVLAAFAFVEIASAQPRLRTVTQPPVPPTNQPVLSE